MWPLFTVVVAAPQTLTIAGFEQSCGNNCGYLGLGVRKTAGFCANVPAGRDCFGRGSAIALKPTQRHSMKGFEANLLSDNGTKNNA